MLNYHFRVDSFTANPILFTQILYSLLFATKKWRPHSFSACSTTCMTATPDHRVSFKGRVYTFGNCQRPVPSLGVSQYMHEINKPAKLWAQLVFEVARK